MVPLVIVVGVGGDEAATSTTAKYCSTLLKSTAVLLLRGPGPWRSVITRSTIHLPLVVLLDSHSLLFLDLKTRNVLLLALLFLGRTGLLIDSPKLLLLFNTPALNALRLCNPFFQRLDLLEAFVDRWLHRRVPLLPHRLPSLLHRFHHLLKPLLDFCFHLCFLPIQLFYFKLFLIQGPLQPLL